MLPINSRLFLGSRLNFTPLVRSYSSTLIRTIPINLQTLPLNQSLIRPLLLQKIKVNLPILSQSVRMLSTSIPRRANWQDDLADRYTRLNRFQQYQQNGYNNNNGSKDSLIKLTLISVGSMVGIFLTSHLLFEYIPPFTYFKNKPKELVYTILGINLAVFALWQSPKMWPTLQKYMLLQKGQLINKWSIIGSAFSHQEFWHLGMNMLALWSFGTSLASMLGTANFFSLYMNSAIAGSLFSMWYPVLARMMTIGPSLGASSALFGVFGCFAYLIPNAKILLFVFPIPGGAWVAFLASVVWNAAGCALRWGSFDYAAHLGGSAMGVLYGWLIHKKVEERRQRFNTRLSGSSSSSSKWF